MAAEIGVLPWDFWAMTPAEFVTRCAGYRRAQQRVWERTAWLVSHMYAPHMRKGRRPPSPAKLLGRARTPGSHKNETTED